MLAARAHATHVGLYTAQCRARSYYYLVSDGMPAVTL